MEKCRYILLGGVSPAPCRPQDQRRAAARRAPQPSARARGDVTGIGPVPVRQPRVRDREVTVNGPDRIRFSPTILPPNKTSLPQRPSNPGTSVRTTPASQAHHRWSVEGSLGYQSPMAFERAHTGGTASPGVAKSAAVLATVKDKPSRAAEAAVLDRRSARRRALRVGRDGRMGSAGAEQKDGHSTTKEVDATSIGNA